MIQSYLIQKCFYSLYYVQYLTGLYFIFVYFPGILIINEESESFFEVNVGHKDLWLWFCIHCVSSYLSIKVIQDLSPMHVVFLQSFLLLFKFLQFSKIILLVIWIISIFIVTIGFFVYTESIVIKFCGLNYYVEKNIVQRGEDEFLLSLKMKRA